MLTQFRVRYPKGSLISELVQIDRGKYIVRASVAVDGITLATGMAAAETVEQAEDRARERVLAVVALDTNSLGEGNLDQNSQRAPEGNNNISVKDERPGKDRQIIDQPTPAKTAPPLTATVSDNSPSQTEIETNSRELNLSTTQNSASDLPGSNSATNELDLNYDAVDIEADLKDTNLIHDAEIELESSSGAMEIPIEIALPEEEENVAPNPTLSIQEEQENNSEGQTIQEEQENNSEGQTIDYTEVIARTTFEMNRLGWTEEQGRNHLKEIYGRRSRHSLTDRELLQFLKFLEEQPDPV